MAWNLDITGPAQKEFQKLPARDQARVKGSLARSKVEELDRALKMALALE
jgi:hypothetical protein